MGDSLVGYCMVYHAGNWIRLDMIIGAIRYASRLKAASFREYRHELQARASG